MTGQDRTVQSTPSTPACLRTILIADDEAETRGLVSDYLALRGYVVVCVGTTSDAVTLLGQLTVDLVLLDLLMPDGDGRCVLAAARQLTRIPPVLFLTGCALRRLEQELLDQGAVGCIRKPFCLTELLTEIQRHCASGTA
jgi:CheY-like chemotaxis protein